MSDDPRQQGSRPKHPYTAPALTEYGSIAELTRTSGGRCVDNNNGFHHQQLPGFNCDGSFGGGGS